MRFLIFGIVFSFVMGLMNRYVYTRFFKKIHFNVQKSAKTVLWILFSVEILFVLESRTHIFPESPLLYYLLSLSVGITVTLFFVTLLYDLLHTTASKIPFDTGRRRFVKIIFDVTMLILAFSYLLRGLVGGLKKPVLNHVPIEIKDFPFESFLIAQLSDVHVGRTIGKEFVQECVNRINDLQPDMVVITGDLVDMKIEHIADALAPLKELQSRFGTFFVLGNHEYFHHAPSIVSHLSTLNIKPLLNENVLIKDKSAAFNLVGINDLISKRMGVMPYDIEKAFKGVDETLPTIVLAHQPKSTLVMQHKHYDLMISGHTHGGQIFPFGLLVMADQPYLAGLYDVDKSRQIFVSRGTGYWGPPVRVLAPSEISVLHLQQA